MDPVARKTLRPEQREGCDQSMRLARLECERQ
jgi:hypothetical protein